MGWGRGGGGGAGGGGGGGRKRDKELGVYITLKSKEWVFTNCSEYGRHADFTFRSTNHKESVILRRTLVNIDYSLRCLLKSICCFANLNIK